MARLRHCGAEVEAGSTGGPDNSDNLTGVSRDTTLFRSGLASWKCDSGAGNTNVDAGIALGVTAQASTTYFLRAYLCFTNLPGATHTVMAFGNVPGGTGYSVKITTGGKLRLYFGAGQVGSDSVATISADGSTWYRVELKVVMDASSQISAGELQLDGVSVATDSGRTLAVTPTGFPVGWVPFGGEAAPGANSVLNIDDAAINDSTGSLNNTWPGDGKVVMLFPISDNARVGWTNAAAGTTNLFNDVDNTPPLGVASPTTQPQQIKRAANNTTDTYDANLTSYTTAGLDAADTLNAITIWFNIGYSNANVSSQGLQMLSNPVISEFTTSTDGSVAGTYNSHWTWGSKVSEYSGTVSSNVTVGTSPVLRVRKNTASASRIQFCDFMGAYVDYTPVVATALPFDTQQGALHDDPFSLQVIQQAGSRAAVW